MKLSSLLLGDLADLFQDSRIEDVQSTANSAVSSASHNGKQIARLATVTEERIQEVEAENAILGMLLFQVLKKLSEKDPDAVQHIVGEVRTQLSAAGNAPKGLAFLNQALNLPEAKKKTPISDYARPATLRPTRPSRPLPVKPKTGT